MTGQGHIPGEKARFGPFEADLRARELRKFGIRIKLQDQPFKLLTALLEHPGELLTREDLQRRIWGNDIVVDFDHSLGTALNKVRDALSDSRDHPRYIETLPRRGYRFIAPVEFIEVEASRVGMKDATEARAPRSVIEVQPRPSKLRWEVQAPKSRRSWPIFAGGAIVILLAMAERWNSTPYLPTVRYSEITRSGRVSLGEDNIERFQGMGTDGVRLYFSEIRDGKLVLASCLLSGGESQIISTPAEIVRPSLADISRDGSTLLVRSQPLSELEGPLWIVSSSGSGASRVPGGEGHAASWLPDGKGIIYASGHDLLTIHNPGTAPHRLATLPGRAFWIRYSPDGSRVRFTILDSATHASSLWEMSSDGTRLHRLLTGWRHPAAECCGSWSADGSYYVFQAAQGGTSDVWALPDGSWSFGRSTRPIQVTAGPLSYYLPVPSASGGRLFVIGAHTRSQLVGIDSSSGLPIPWPTNLNACRIAFSPDGQFIAWVELSDGSLWRSRLDGSQRLRLTSSSLQAYRVAWSPDSRLLAFDAREPGRHSRIYLVAVNGGVPEVLVREERNQADPSWSADGNILVFGRLPDLGEDSAEKAIYLVDVKSRRLSMLRGSSGLFSPRWSPDGRRIAAMPLSQRMLMIFDLASGRWSSVDVHDTATAPTWSMDSRFIYWKAQQQNVVYRVFDSPELVTRLEKVVGMDAFQSADSFSLVGMSPRNSPLLLMKSSTADIYGLTWDASQAR